MSTNNRLLVSLDSLTASTQWFVRSSPVPNPYHVAHMVADSWGGALLFVAFMAEMRHPMDFWKGMLCAQLFIGIVYVFFGTFVYSHYGQYSASNIGNVIQPLHLQQVNNIIGLITAGIACCKFLPWLCFPHCY